MKGIFRFTVVLTVFLGTLGSFSVQAQNTVIGYDAFLSNTSGTNDSAFGNSTLTLNTTGSGNTAVGNSALYENTAGSSDTAVGSDALVYSSGIFNTAAGLDALDFNTTGNSNTATGYLTLQSNTEGSYLTATGSDALHSNTTGGYNTATGADALERVTTGGYNTAIGFDAAQTINTGSYNIAIGQTSGYYNPASSSYNIDIGSVGASSDSGAIRIGATSYQTSFYAAGISGVNISSGVPVYINGSGQLGTVNSSIRFKEDVHDMAGASDKLFQLRPVTYRYKQAYADGSRPVDYGLIAEEVAQVYPDMVARDASGEILTVQYQKLIPMLLNEIQKQHRQLSKQEKTIQMLEQRLSALEVATQSTNLKSSVPAE